MDTIYAEGDYMRVSVDIEWTDFGGIDIDESGKLTFPELLVLPGLYRFRCSSPEATWQYIGETDNLRRRSYHYRSPGPSQWTNLRLNDLIRGELALGHRIAVAIMTRATIEADGVTTDADMSLKAVRRLIEDAAIIAATATGEHLHNL